MQFTDCGLETVTLQLHVHMCTVEELSVIVSIYIYSCILPTVEHTYVHIYSSAILTQMVEPHTGHSTEVDIIILSASIIIYCKSEITTIYIIIIIIL